MLKQEQQVADAIRAPVFDQGALHRERLGIAHGSEPAHLEDAAGHGLAHAVRTRSGTGSLEPGRVELFEAPLQIGHELVGGEPVDQPVIESEG
ncbi:MAG TPA: hypothetical protein VN759_05325, partial [Pseudolysinimonas sp.]|nr:hypothetical protein [Pseudolysinimonas sp.]